MQNFGPKMQFFLGRNPFFSEIVQIFCYHHDWTPKRQHFCVHPVARRASGRPPGPIFGPKICIFVRYTYETPIFWVRRTGPIISPPYPEVTLDNFGFPVGGRLAARRAVFRPRLPKVSLLGSKNAVFWPKTNLLWSASKINSYINDGTPKRQL